MNNIEDERLSTRFQEVDYYPGITTPTNFAQLISGSAVKATVQDSNYTSKRIINPRYDGVKSTSQYLNVWTPGDTGTYGKLPTIENLKTAVAYCDWIGGWPPDKMNASAIHVLYLIKSDGTVVIPNTSQNSLTDIKNNFESGERLIIESKTIPAGQSSPYRTIIRGGTTIVPLMSNQIGQYISPTNQPEWTGSIFFEDPSDPTNTTYFTTGSTPTTSLIRSGSGPGYENAVWIDLSINNRILAFQTNNNTTQLDIPTSGLNPFIHPGIPQPGDEFRFMGLEQYTFLIASSSFDLTPFSEKIIFYLDKPVPTFTDASPSSTWNLNKFLIRRYVDDASQILMEGFKPTNSSGPYLVRPEFVAPELNKSIDQFILDLTQKGLIP